MSESAIARRRRAAAEESRDGYNQRRREVLEAAAHVFREKGFTAATLNDVAQRVATDRASIYYYFSGKGEILDEILRSALQGVATDGMAIAESSAPADEKLRMLVRRMIEDYAANLPFALVLVQATLSAENATTWSPEVRELQQALPRAVSKVLEEGVRDKIFRDDLSLQAVSNAFWGMIIWTFQGPPPGEDPAPREIADMYTDLLLSGLLRP